MGKIKEMAISQPVENQEPNNFSFLRTINVNHAIEKKGNLSYLSWANAYDILLQHDSNATWKFHTFDHDKILEGQHQSFHIKEKQYYQRLPDGSALVFADVTAFGKTKTSHLPVMDYKNKAIANFNAFELNTALWRCFAKAISLHGIGLYIYAGEDLPPNPEIERKINKCKSLEELKKVWESLTKEERMIPSSLLAKNNKKEQLDKTGEANETEK